MFGPWGNDDTTDATRIIHRAIDAASTHRHRRRLLRRLYLKRSSAKHSRAAATHRPGDQVLHAHGRRQPQPPRGSRRWIMTEVENSLRPAATDHIDLYQDTGPAPTRPRRKRSAPSPTSSGRARVATSAPRSTPIADRRGPVGSPRTGTWNGLSPEQPPYSILVRGIEADVLPTAQRHGWAR